MALRLYNTATRSVDEFAPIEPPRVRLYTCGPTVYNFAHIGNLRTYVFEDVLKRALRLGGFDVRHVMNVTDVGHLTSDADQGEDKMELGAAREGKTAWDIAAFYWQAFRKDIAALNVIEPDTWCKATDYIEAQVELVRVLERKGYTYVIENDGVYFDTARFPQYGKFARLDVSGLRAGARIELAEGKRNATDFALWKFSPKDKKRQMEWPSPWGTGFPGWHIECSAMAIRELGERLDIHCGGIDHVQVHHTNEIAQSQCALGHKWCNWWMHGEFLVLPKAGEGEAKMSKSSGEFLTLDVLVKKGYDPLAYRYFLLTAHYRQQLLFTWEGLDAAAHALKNLRKEVIELRKQSGGAAGQLLPAHDAKFREAVENDLNMPQVLAAVWGAVRDEAAAPADRLATAAAMDAVLGLGLAEAKEEALDITPEQIEGLIAERAAARKGKDFARGDAIRKELLAKGVVLEDSAKGTTWRRA